MPEPAPTVTPPPADLTGRTLGDFQVLRRIGSGGMGQVYLARQLSLKRDVALKLLKSDLAQNETALKRFQAEAEAVARISHPNIVQVYAIGEQDGARFMALEYVEGRNLRDFLMRKGPPDLNLSLAIIRQVALALQRASELGIVHRDIKPENILLTRRGEVKVTDFGLSRLTAQDEKPMNLTQSGVTLGTPLYMSPEQVRGLPTDSRTDLYSLGVTCYQLFTGNPPFLGKTALDVAMKHVSEMAEPLQNIRPDLPADLCTLVHKLMAKQPEDRYQSAKDLVRDLTRLREGKPLGQSGTVGLPVAQPASASQSAPFAQLGQVSPFAELSSSAPTIAYIPAQADVPSRWPGRILGGLAMGLIFLLGWWTFGRVHPTAEPVPVAGDPGLPTARLPAVLPLLSNRERELISRLEKRGLTAAEVLSTSIDLGLLQVKEKRYWDAMRTFEKLEKEPAESPRFSSTSKHIPAAAKFGQGVVLSFQDKAKESNSAFLGGVHQFINNPQGKNPQPRAHAALSSFLLQYPELTEKVAESIVRNNENLGLTKSDDPILDRLRLPPKPNPFRDKN